jgi:glycosyltransferase involved in cell wall biosynthesis
VTRPRLSVCIPTYERLAYLREAVASAQDQTLSEVEILIGDDGESRELRAWAEATASNDPRVRYLKTPERLRLARNWSFLAQRAQGEFVTLIGDDDRLLPTFAERLLAEVKPEVAVVFANQYFIDADGKRLESSESLNKHYGRSELRPGVLPDARVAVWRNSVPSSSSIVRTSDVRRLDFKADINTPELELFARLAGEGVRFAFVPEYLAEYRHHAGSETASGLTVDRLAEYLAPIAVPAEVEPVKRARLEQLVLAGVTMRLGRGDIAGARRLRELGYYPTREALGVRAAQELCLALPDPLAAAVFRNLRDAARFAGKLVAKGVRP